MPSFEYVARDAQSGKEILASILADTEDAAIVMLLKRNQLVVAIKELKHIRTKGPGKVGLKDLVVFTRQLATMVDAGMAIVGCLKSLAKQSRSKAMQDVISDLTTRVETGDSFSDALGKHPKAFDGLYLSMVSAGEKGGMLAESLNRLATQLESAERLRRKVKTAMMYPLVVSIVALGVTTFLLVKVVPVFGEIYDSFKGKLPAPTECLIEFSNFVRTWFIAIAAVIGGGVFAWLHYIKTPGGRWFWDSKRIKLPIFGRLAHYICLARFTRTLSSLLTGGVPILEALQTVSKSCGNVVMEKAVIATTEDIEVGKGISDAMGRHEVFPDMILDMISAGEQTGKLDDMLKRVAAHLDEEVDSALAGLTSMIEPIIIVFLALIIGTVVICMFLPIFKLSDLVSANK
jgi:type IV pilus assembly protein PilC